MQVIADLQLHSKHARAVSPNMVVPEIARWAKKKGIGLVATGDWTHPLWLRELEANLEEAGEGVFRIHPRGADSVPPRGWNTLFLLSTEVSCIYSQGGRQRRIHILIFAPSFETVHKINEELRRRGANLMSDGRPIMGLSSKEVAELVLEVDDRCLIIPAHAWTPWFSLYGSASGFDSIEECFGEFSKYIYAIETGLSSSPEMNWRIAELEDRSIVSFSDAHSPPKLGREATVFDLPELTYPALKKAITEPELGGIAYTIEFYPEEGKYHYTGHRKCGVKQSPEETRKFGTICTVCGKKLTVGVLHRVEELATNKTNWTNLSNKQSLSTIRSNLDAFGVRWLRHPEEKRPPYVMLVPLLEILSEALEAGTGTQTVLSEYEKLTNELGPEFEILMRIKPEEVERFSGPKVREAIMKVRSGDILVDPGFDGEFGKVKIWELEEENKKEEQASLFE